MTVDEALDEWAVRQHRQPFCTGVVQHGFDEYLDLVPVERRAMFTLEDV